MAAEPPGVFRRLGRAVRNAFRRVTGRPPVPPPEVPTPPEVPPEVPPPTPPEAPPEAPPVEPEAPEVEEPERRLYGNPDQIRPDNWRGVYPTLQPILSDFQRNVPPGIWALDFEPDEDGWVLYVGDSP